MADTLPPTANARNSRERSAPALDLADRLVMLQRRQAGPSRRVDRPTTSVTANPQQHDEAQHSTVQSTQSAASALGPSVFQRPPPPPPLPTFTKTRSPRPPSPDDFDRRTRLPTNDAPRPQGRLYNPNSDSPSQQRQMHHRQSDAMSEASSSADHVRRPHPLQLHHHPPTNKLQHSHLSHGGASSLPPPSQPRQLFNPRTDDPMRFNLLTRTTVKPSGPPSGGYLSASATSMSDAQSIGSNFSLTSGTTSSSASGPYSPHNGRDLGGSRLWLDQVKRMYRDIAKAESKILAEGDTVEEEPDSRNAAFAPQSLESDEKWARLVKEHKNLVELYHNFLSFASRPQTPASLHPLPAKYNIPGRLWNHGVQRLLSALRRASLTSVAALEQLESFIIYAYGFYCSLMEEVPFSEFRVLWLEALGDLARYKMHVVAHIAEGAPKLSTALLPVPMSTLTVSVPQESISPGVSRMDDRSAPSVGLQAAAEMELEDEGELWRRTARDWYAKGIKDTPGQGRLHHHLGLVSLDAKGEELRAVYHFAKSLVATHGCDIARESILPLFSLSSQGARYQPSSSAPSIFVLLQGQLFTRIQLDDFAPTLARFIERLTLFPTEVAESDWTMMGVLNICAMLEYGKPDGLLRNMCALAPGLAGPSRPSSSRTPRRGDHGAQAEDQMDVDSTMTDADATEDAQDLSATMMALTTDPPSIPAEAPYTLQLAFELTFELLSYALRKPFLPSKSPFRPDAINPYIVIVLTFLATIVKNEQALALVDRYVPWADIAMFFTETYRRTSSSRTGAADDSSRPTHKWFGSNPLPEDWCLRGSEWVRKLYERGFWRVPSSSGKASEGITSEMDVLIAKPCVADDLGDGIVEDDDGGDDAAAADMTSDWSHLRWKRLRWAAETIMKQIPGLQLNGQGRHRTVTVVGVLKAKVEAWQAQKAKEEEEDRQRRDRSTSKADVDMDIDEDLGGEDEDAEDDFEDSPGVRELKARRRYLRSLQSPSHTLHSSHHSRPLKRAHPKAKATRPLLQVAAGYTILIVDTNILLSSMPYVSELIQSNRWTVVVPLAVITELDGLSHNTPSELGVAASEALSYLIAAIQTHSSSLKVQTSRGNYLFNLSIRSEVSTLGAGERNMDDLILRSALWQSHHFMDRSDMLDGDAPYVTEKTSKAVLLTFDRNLRLKARSRKLDAADEKDMDAIFSTKSRR
ncbi:hypothetical protein FRB96_005625 [Tulasnella sp. 330]|nr:hypothetical protein FRB96_005625 [Tulasnella sp. 330]KAG8886383.1 hypothetical protein FRB97_004918 [Tulasnella sp. 331]